MDSKFVPSKFEEKIYAFWEKNNLFKAVIDPNKKPFCVILPPPNANGHLHLGHAMFTYEDILIRHRKMKGDSTFWLLGLDHAGFETQYVFEKHLKKQGKSRFDYKREELFQMILDYVNENKKNIKGQLRRLGFALDWSREKFTMDPEIVKIVHGTFKKLFEKGLIYRGNRLINYCTYCGTSLSDLEINYVERIDPLYYIKYGPFTLATVRPETKFGDTAVAVHPDDKRYKKWVGKEIEVQGVIGPFKVKVVADEAVDREFGTGAVKVTPAHDFNDYEIAKRHNLPMKQVIGFDGRLNEFAGKYKGMKVNAARIQITQDMQTMGLIEKIKEDYTHRVGTCYKCARVLEPLPKEQWFIKIKPLADRAKKLIKEKKTVIFPKRFEKQMVRILDNYIDWNISRQVVWGIRIPAYQCASQSSKVKVPSSAKASAGEQKWFVSLEKPEKCQVCGECDFVQDEDTFDTWFSSAQWPFATLMSCSNSKLKMKNGKLNLYKYFYPTSVMETGHDIMRAWVARMMMIGEFVTGQPPFKTVFLHGMVRDGKGQKMSKSKGNVIDPILLMDKYGTDALRAALIFGTKEGGDVALSEQKVVGMRNFANKIWNMGRLIQMNESSRPEGWAKGPSSSGGDRPLVENNKIIKEMEKEFAELKKGHMKLMDSYRFSQALEGIYEFVWHRFADHYLEELKEEIRNGNIEVLKSVTSVYMDSITMLHPFMPFVTEALAHELLGEKTSLLQIGYK